MNPDLPSEAAEYGAGAARAFASLGGLDAARRAEVDPAERGRSVARALEALGADQLDPRADPDAAAAAGELCRAAGRVMLPYPVVPLLLRTGGAPLAVVGEGRLRVDHGDLFDEWRVATVDGRAQAAKPASSRLATKLGPFVVDLSPGGPQAEPAHRDVAFHLTLSAWLVLGVIERAVELAVEHVSGRVQFGQALSSFQAVQFQLADAAVGVEGLRELCRFTLWRLFADPERCQPDALAVRLHALETARTVLRTTQQLHGAAGLCDEYDISILCRHVQPCLRLPFGSERTALELAGAVERMGFDSLFPHGARSAVG
ncbi:MAG TPA: acyl-CoA dehydrogenase family protein [Acidimicrobiales bacterium]|nr:acyl-CoA dehydrogenase family protein [Acidimicrobiales bacterium]